MDIYDILSGLPLPLALAIGYLFLKQKELLGEVSSLQNSKEKIIDKISTLEKQIAVNESTFKLIKELIETKQISVNKDTFKVLK